ncbi:MAG: GGDEF domain-containing protein [Lachnospiraceae bacterium]|nr:GGDEF domain-containing protein [Lachnospiraceae bacterium]
MRTIVLSADIACLFSMIIILLATQPHTKNERISTRLFQLNIIIGIIGLIIESTAIFLDGKTRSILLIKILNMVPYILCAVLLVTFTFYMISVIRESEKVSYKLSIPTIVIASVDIVFIIVANIKGKLLDIKDYASQPGEWASITGAMAAICLGYLYYVMFRHIKILGKNRSIAFFMYMLLPIFSALAVLFFDFPDFTYVTISISFEIIFVMIQMQTITESRIREKILFEASYIETLTNLKNRRAYEEKLENMVEGKMIGVVFCDMNMLKYVNDTFGHVAGDEYIKKFADILRESFGDGDIYRISGDEFVVFLENIANEQEMEKRMTDFREVVNKNERIASFGYIYTENNGMLDIMHIAEERMYEDKNKYYEETNKKRRKF